MAYLHTGSEAIGNYGRHRAYVKYTTSSTNATTYKINVDEVGENFWGTGSSDTYSTWGPSTVRYTLDGHSGYKVDNDSISATVSSSSSKYLSFGTVNYAKTYTMTTSSQSVVLKVNWQWSSVDRTSSTSVTIPRLRRVDVTFHVNGGSIPDNPHYYADADRYFKVTSNKIYYRDGSSGDFAVYHKYLYPTTEHYNCYNYTTWGLSRTGYHGKDNAEWNLKSDGSGNSFSQNDTTSNSTNVWTTKRLNGGSEITADTDVTLYANWEKNTYKVHFNANGGSGSMSDESFTYGTAKNLTSNGFTAPSGGYSFYGWATTLARAQAGTRTYQNGASVSNLTTEHEGVVNLYAIWSRTVTFKSGQSGATSGTSTQYYGGNVTPKSITAISTWTALGWRDDTTAGAKEYGANNTTAFAYTGIATTLYAAYSRTLTISYAAGGGSGTTPSNTTTTQYYNSYGNVSSPTVTLATNPYTYSGRSFTNWLVSVSSTLVNSGGTYTWSIAVGTTSTSRTATAQWASNVYTLTINPNGGTWNGSAATQTFSQSSGSIKNIMMPEKPGCRFLGWVKVGGGQLDKHFKYLTTQTNQLDTDPAFDSGVGAVSVYNNSGGTTVTHTRQSSSAGYGSYEIKITTAASGSVSPELGGFIHNTASIPNATFIHSFVAKIPVGYTILNAQNATGNDRTITWITDRAGTGQYETYAYIHRCGSTGTFNTFGHVYVQNNTKPVTWYLACSNMIEITNGFNEVYTFGSANGTLIALWTPINMWVNINNVWKRCKEMWINENNVWRSASNLSMKIQNNFLGINYNPNIFDGTDMTGTMVTSSSGDWSQPFRYYNGSTAIHSIANETDTITLNQVANLGISFVRKASDVDLSSSSWYTISCEAKSTQTSRPLCIGLSYYKTDNTWYWNGGANPQVFNQANTWQSFSFTFKPASDTQYLDYCFTVAGTDGGTDTFSIRHCKLEKGVVATPWTPTPYYGSGGGDASINYTFGGTLSNGINNVSRTITELVNVNAGRTFTLDGTYSMVPQIMNVAFSEPLTFTKGTSSTQTIPNLTWTLTYNGNNVFTAYAPPDGTGSNPLVLTLNFLTY